MNKWITMCIVVCIFFLSAYPAFAADDNFFEIRLAYGDTAISGAEFSLYQVATLEDGRTRYQVKAPFVDQGHLQDIEHPDKAWRLADHFAKQAAQMIPARKIYTNDSGLASASGLADGIYLVVQTGAQGRAEKYSFNQPYLVMLPENINGHWENHVSAMPKPSIQPEKPIKTTVYKKTPLKPPITQRSRPLPVTGDGFNITMWAELSGACGFLLMLMGVREYYLAASRGKERVA